jgi:hypothetical protein
VLQSEGPPPLQLRLHNRFFRFQSAQPVQRDLQRDVHPSECQELVRSAEIFPLRLLHPSVWDPREQGDAAEGLPHQAR